MLSDPELLKAKNVNNRTELFILRVMVGLIILYDHVHSEGAFAKGNIIIYFQSFLSKKTARFHLHVIRHVHCAVWFEKITLLLIGNYLCPVPLSGGGPGK